jgi:hypothetical protein
MKGRRISYTLDGDTFVGLYQVDQRGGAPQISVEFERATASASVGSQPEEQVARALLGQLVRDKVVPTQHPSR